MLLFEIKKVIKKPLNKIVILILLAIIILGSILTIRDVKFTDEQGNTTSGIFAARSLKAEKNKWKGYITEDVLKRVIRENQINNSSPEALSKDVKENNKAFARSQSYSDIKELINLAFSEFDNYDYFKADTISEDHVGELYQRRIKQLKQWLNSSEISHTFSNTEKMWLTRKYEELKTPFFYEYADGWKALLDSQFLPTLILVTVLLIGLLVSGIFSDEFSWKAESIFFSTKLGRSTAAISKIGAGLLICTILYWVVVLSYSITVLLALGFEGGLSPVQTGISNWNSIYNITYLQDFLITTIGGYIGCIFIVMLTMIISAKTHSTVLAIPVSFALTCIPPFVGRIAVFSRIMTLFPDQLLRINKSLEDFTFYSILGHTMSGLEVIIPVYLFLDIIMLPVLYIINKKIQVS